MKHGAALPIALMTITMTSALAVGGMFVARSVVASARLTQRAPEVQARAESALVHAVVSWDSAARVQQPVGVTVSLNAASTSEATTEAWATRLGASTFWLVAETTSRTRPLLRRRLGLVVRVSAGLPVVVPRRGWSELP